ncbi:MAG TPA: hypothetical protein VGI44_04520 [Acidimicrobiales bacterium]
MKFSLKRISKKGVVFGLSAGVALGLTGAAFAFFTSTGSGSGSATTGSAGSWGVVASASTGTMYPGQGTASVPFTITNNGSGNQALNSETPTVASSGGNVETTAGNPATAVAGCLATWYVPVNGTPSPANLTSIAPAATVSDTVTVTMTDAPTSQNSCQGIIPAITLSVG